MNDLTKEQNDFLIKHNISIDMVFDAKGLGPSKYRDIMREKNKFIAINVSPCKKKGHTMRIRTGHCLQCDPRGFIYLIRSNSPGIVYIARTNTGKRYKVGYSSSIEKDREKSLNRTSYAGFSDWTFLFIIQSSVAGFIENEVKKKLYFKIRGSYYKHDGEYKYSSEAIDMPYLKLRELIINHCNELGYDYEIILDEQI